MLKPNFAAFFKPLSLQCFLRKYLTHWVTLSLTAWLNSQALFFLTGPLLHLASCDLLFMHTVLWENEGGNAPNYQSDVGMGQSFSGYLLGGDVSRWGCEEAQEKSFKRFIWEGGDQTVKGFHKTKLKWIAGSVGSLCTWCSILMLLPHQPPNLL